MGARTADEIVDCNNQRGHPLVRMRLRACELSLSDSQFGYSLFGSRLEFRDPIHRLREARSPLACCFNINLDSLRCFSG